MKIKDNSLPLFKVIFDSSVIARTEGLLQTFGIVSDK